MTTCTGRVGRRVLPLIRAATFGIPAFCRRPTFDAAHDLGINVSAVADAALRKAVIEARRTRWLGENADAFAGQAEWHDRHGHPLADIIVSPGKATWEA